MHLIIILDRHLQCASEQASSESMPMLASAIDELRTKSVQLDEKLKRNQIPPFQKSLVESLLDNIQSLAIDMCDNSAYADKHTEVNGYIAEVETYL